MLLAELHVVTPTGFKHLGYLEIIRTGSKPGIEGGEERDYRVELKRLKAEATEDSLKIVTEVEKTTVEGFPPEAGPWALVTWALSELESQGKL